MPSKQCPYCGYPAYQNGDRWECPSCGDVGAVRPGSAPQLTKEQIRRGRKLALRVWLAIGVFLLVGAVLVHMAR